MDIENRMQNKNGNFNPAGRKLEAEKKIIARVQSMDPVTGR